MLNYEQPLLLLLPLLPLLPPFTLRPWTIPHVPDEPRTLYNLISYLISQITPQTNFRLVTLRVTSRNTYCTLTKTQFVFIIKTKHIYAGLQKTELVNNTRRWLATSEIRTNSPIPAPRLASGSEGLRRAGAKIQGNSIMFARCWRGGPANNRSLNS